MPRTKLRPSRPPAFCAAGAAALLCVVLGCSSGAQGPLVDCVAPGAACCQNQECAIGLTCENDVCVAMDAGAPPDAGSVDARAE